MWGHSTAPSSAYILRGGDPPSNDSLRYTKTHRHIHRMHHYIYNTYTNNPEAGGNSTAPSSAYILRGGDPPSNKTICELHAGKYTFNKVQRKLSMAHSLTAHWVSYSYTSLTLPVDIRLTKHLTGNVHAVAVIPDMTHITLCHLITFLFWHTT